MFETLERKPPDAILKLIGEYANDTRDNKIDLGVGIYRDRAGDTPVFSAIKKAEQLLVDTQTSKAYLGSRGAADYCAAIQALSFGDDAAGDDRVVTLQTPGGSGALRVAAGVIMRANSSGTAPPSAVTYISPCKSGWALPLFAAALPSMIAIDIAGSRIAGVNSTPAFWMISRAAVRSRPETDASVPSGWIRALTSSLNLTTKRPLGFNGTRN